MPNLANPGDALKVFYLILLGSMALLPFVGFLALVIGLIVWSHRQDQKRTADLQGVAGQLALPFYPQGDPTLVTALAQFQLFSQGHARKTNNMLHGQTDDVELGIFDYKYTVGGGKSSSTCRQSVVAFRSPLLRLPDFVLRPESVFHRIGKVFGYQDIDFESHPGFSQAFILRGSDELRIREFFSAEVLSFFEGIPGISVEGGGDRLIFYRSRVRVEPVKIRSFMDEGFKIYVLFRNRSQEVRSKGGSPFGSSG